jgi:hypothetical protein
VKKPLLAQTLKLMRNPARLAGMGDLQDFLERGFAAFRDMKGADDFLDAGARRETAILNRLFSAAADPFFGLAGAAFAGAKSASSSCWTALSIDPFMAFSRNPSETSRWRSLAVIAKRPGHAGPLELEHVAVPVALQPELLAEVLSAIASAFVRAASIPRLWTRFRSMSATASCRS